jgi:general secretion pathway protein A
MLASGMYKEFYELKRKPFEISPDPAFFFQTARHNEALANLAYGISWRKGFIVLTGEVGTGKTLLLNCLLDLLKRVQIGCAHIVNTRLTATEFLRHMVADLEVSTCARDKSELLLDLNKYLIERCRRGSTTVLIVDEAHLLSWDVLEEIRLVGNLETTQEKLLQIVLAGQPELDRTLDSLPLRQLKQRIALRCELEPLREHEVGPYINRRLTLAGAEPDNTLFPLRTVELIYKYSSGIPRLVNTICENALVIGCAQQVRTITPLIVEEVASDFHLTKPAHVPGTADSRAGMYHDTTPAASVS